MAQGVRAIGSVVAGAATWALLWIGGTRAIQALFPTLADPTQPMSHVGLLLGYVGFSVVLSVLAGWVTGTLRGPEPMPAVWGLAALQLTLGIVAEVSYWDLLPVWYHLVFLALLVPATVYGGMTARRRMQVGVT